MKNRTWAIIALLLGENMKWIIWDHSAFPGPDYWDFKCLECDGLVIDHAPWPLIILRNMVKWFKK